VDLLVKLGVEILKIPSGEVTNAPLMLRVASTGLPVLMSTGMCTLGDIEEALGVVAFGLLKLKNPSVENFRKAYSSKEGQNALKSNVTLLHCTTEYPAPIQDTNLLAINTLRSAFGLPVGYSDHTEGIEVSVAAVALGATVIEKHFTLDRNLPGPDHKASLEHQQLKQMVDAIRKVEIALGNGIKKVAPSEAKNQPIARRSIVAMTDIKKGESFTEENLGFMRPADGISPMHYWEFVGKKAGRDYKKDEKISRP
jgi:sialic acid synthase SpsE